MVDNRRALLPALPAAAPGGWESDGAFHVELDEIPPLVGSLGALPIVGRRRR